MNRSLAVLAARCALALVCGLLGSPAQSGDLPVAVRRPGVLDSLARALGPERYHEVLRLDRRDAAHARRADTLVVPDSMAFGIERVFPDRLPEADSLRRLLVVALRVQWFAAYDSGRLVRSGPVSSGKASTPTPAGLYWANWKAVLHRSSIDSSWIMPWTVNFESRIGIALHQYAMPGRPASHCCVRLLEADARWIFDWVETWTLAAGGRRVIARGTPIVVLGAYDFDAPAPWRRLPVDPHATRLQAAELDELVRSIALARPAAVVVPLESRSRGGSRS